VYSHYHLCISFVLLTEATSHGRTYSSRRYVQTNQCLW
jgi:hypothetical protein